MASSVNEAVEHVTQGDALINLYGTDAAKEYDAIMAAEMAKYEEDLNLVCERIQPESAIVDTALGSGHMLAYLAEKLPPTHKLIGMDLSPAMVEVAQNRLENVSLASVQVGNMLDTSMLEKETFGLVLNNFAIHHAEEAQAAQAIEDWASLLIPGGMLYLAAWEGSGAMDFGNMGIVAKCWSEVQLQEWVTRAGLQILVSRSKYEEDMFMNTHFIIAIKPEVAK